MAGYEDRLYHPGEPPDFKRSAPRMRVSVIIPTYNRAALLPRTLAAILAQTCPAAEIIVVDDGSTDATAEMLAGFPAPVRALRIANSGDLAARNAGLAVANGDLVAFCDSDDLWRPEFLAEMLALWERAPELHAAYSDFVIVQGEAWGTETKFAAAPPGFWNGLRALGPGQAVFDRPVIDRLIHFQPLFASCIVARRDWFAAIGGWDNGVARVLSGDFATALRLGAHPPLGIVQKPLVGIRWHQGNISADTMRVTLGEAEVLEHVLATHPAAAPYAAEIRASIALRRRQALGGAFVAGQHELVRRIYPCLPPSQRSLAVRLKHAVSGLPGPFRMALTTALLAGGTARARLRDGG